MNDGELVAHLHSIEGSDGTSKDMQQRLRNMRWHNWGPKAGKRYRNHTLTDIEIKPKLN